jgi:hypothetical protein
MKHFNIISTFLLLALFASACEKDNSTTPTVDPIVGTWKVSSFIKGSDDLTNQFTGFTFICTENGNMTIQGNGRNYNCNWSGMDNDHSEFNINIMGCDNDSVLWECDDDWNLTQQDSDHCYFSSHDSDHHRTMTWIKK